jgi:protein arginine kinase
LDDDLSQDDTRMTDDTREKTPRPSVLSLLAPAPGWLGARELESAIILTTRLRFARNLHGERFPHRQDKTERLRVVAKVRQAWEGVSENVNFVALDELPPLEAGLLVERRMISPQMVRDKLPRAVFLWKEQDISLMICEEDHLRLAGILPGLHPSKLYKILKPIEDELERRLPVAYDSERGYLTTCPANLGDAIRISFFCHLPGLALTGEMENLVQAVSDAGVTVRGFWGEGSEILGNIFQFTDGPSLSLKSVESLQRMETLGHQILDREATARIKLQEKTTVALQDKIARALGILQSCRILESAESLALFSAMRLGTDLGWIHGINRRTISRLTLETGPAFLSLFLGGKAKVNERRILRAEKVRKAFANTSFSV